MLFFKQTLKCFLRGRESSRKGEVEKPADRNGRENVSERQRIGETKQRGFQEGDPGGKASGAASRVG